MDDLEHRYRRLLSAYPAAYRRERGDEILTTLLDSSAPRQRWPHPLDAINLVWNGLSLRAGVAVPAVMQRAHALAAPVALVLTAALAASFLVVHELLPGLPAEASVDLSTANPVLHLNGPVARPPHTITWITYPTWILALLAVVLGAGVAGRALVAVALAVTITVRIVAVVTDLPFAPAYVPTTLVLLGLVVVASPPGSLHLPPRSRLGLLAGAAAVASLYSVTYLADDGVAPGWWARSYVTEGPREGMYLLLLLAAVMSAATLRSALAYLLLSWPLAAFTLLLPGPNPGLVQRHPVVSGAVGTLVWLAALGALARLLHRLPTPQPAAAP